MATIDGRGVRGVIIPTVLFVAMFVLLLSTLLVASVSYNFDLSLGSVEATENRYVSLAAVNELISDLNDGLDPETFTRERPRRVDDGGRIAEVWVEPLEQNQKHVFIVAQTYRQSQGTPQTVKKLAVYKENSVARVYTNSPDSNKNSPDPIYYSDVANSGAWSRVPDVPRMRYTSAGTLEVKPGEVAGTIPYMSGSPDGSLFALYVPVLDGWDDTPTTVLILPLRLGDFALNLMVKGSQEGLTVGDLQPIGQVVIDLAHEITISKGAVGMKFDHDTGEWTPLPPIPEARLVKGEFAIDEGNYHVQGIAGPPASYEGGGVAAVYRKGQDAIYRYSEESNEWSVFKPPGKDILLLAADQSGTTYVQTGDLRPVGLDYLLDILLLNVLDIFPNTSTSALYKYEDEEWSPLPNPPARYFDKSGTLVKHDYSGSRGPSLGGMIGGAEGELVVVSRPPKHRLDLVDTVYRYRDGKWEVVPSPPNKHFDAAGNEVEQSGLPSRLEVGMGPKGQLVLRVPSRVGSDGIFLETEEEGVYDLLPPVRTEDGSFQQFLSQMSVGLQRDGSGKGSFFVRATYF